MKKEAAVFDVVIIGAGSGGLNIANFISRVGLRVLLIDKKDESIGGDCLNFGCVPSKAFLHVARLVRDRKKTVQFGLKNSGEIDMRKVMDYVSSKKDIFRQKENAGYLRKAGIAVVLGEASFIDAKTVNVEGVHYEGRKIIIATGSRPRHLKLAGIENIKVYNNENIFSIDFLPKEWLLSVQDQSE